MSSRLQVDRLSVSQAGVIVAAMSQEVDFSQFANVKFVEGVSSSSVIYSPNGPADGHLIAAFAAHCLEGSGYDWESIVRSLLRQEDPEVLERFRFDCEAGMFCAYGTDLAALHTAAATVERLLADAELTARMLQYAADHDLFD